MEALDLVLCANSRCPRRGKCVCYLAMPREGKQGYMVPIAATCAEYLIVEDEAVPQGLVLRTVEEVDRLYNGARTSDR